MRWSLFYMYIIIVSLVLALCLHVLTTAFNAQVGLCIIVIVLDPRLSTLRSVGH